MIYRIIIANNLRNIFIIFLFISAIVKSQGPLSAVLVTGNAVCLMGSANVSVSGGTPPYSIVWSQGFNGSSVDGLEQGSHQVIVTDAANQDTVINFSIDDVPCLVKCANHFTPNDDGFNDTWSIINANYFPNFEVYVYNRWGQNVYRQKNEYTTPWDGRSLGVALPDATYYYVFYYDKDVKTKFVKGDVTILR